MGWAAVEVMVVAYTWNGATFFAALCGGFILAAQNGASGHGVWSGSSSLLAAVRGRVGVRSDRVRETARQGQRDQHYNAAAVVAAKAA